MSGDDGISFDEAKKLAAHPDANVRASLGAREDLRPELLYFLAEDKDPEVRKAIAANPTAPRQADLLLAKDADEDVRGGIAGKIARLAPDLSREQQDRLRKTTVETLEILARDELVRVRQVLSEALKDVADAPPDVIGRLARDAEIKVAGPVLEHSPVLTDEVLLEIIETGPAKGGLSAIAKRATVSESLSDAVAGTDDIEAIADLLANPSAQIREQTLDDLIERAPEHDLWHAPLVHRPALPGKAAERIALFVADSLLEELEKRDDLDPAALDAVKEVVHTRLGDQPQAVATPDGEFMEFLDIPPPTTVVQRMRDAGRLDENAVSKALGAGDFSFVLAALAVLTGQKAEVVRRVFRARSAEGVISFCWRAGLPMSMALQVQTRMARIAPSQVIQPKNDGYPMAENEMEWQVKYFQDLT